MTISEKQTSRRKVIAGGALATAAAALALVLSQAPQLFTRHYPRSAYDDLLALLNNRESGVRVGRAVLRSLNVFDSKAEANRLRAAFRMGSFAAMAQDDAANGRLIEADGWVLPASFAIVCALAAESA